MNATSLRSLLGLVLVAGLAACTDATTPTDLEPSASRAGGAAEMTGPTIVDIASANPDFSLLVEALATADLVDALDGRRQFTVFAPTNDAFVSTLEALGLTKDEVFGNEELLGDILLHHVVPGARFSDDVLDSDQLRTLQGGFVFPKVTDMGVFIVDGTAATPDAAILIDAGLFDIEASNGVIHVIDQVLVPGDGSGPGDFDEDDADDEGEDEGEDEDEEDGDDEGEDEGDDDADAPTIAELVASFATADENAEFTILYDIVQTAGLVDALGGERNLTVFAPTDAAFQSLIDALVGELGEEQANAILADPEALRDILLYHVLPGARFSEQVLDSEVLVTLNGGSLFPEANDDGVFLVDENELTEDAALILDLIDIEAGNGVVHVIDEVLLPR